jgi:hypothetical protein
VAVGILGARRAADGDSGGHCDGRGMRVALATTHLPLRSVADAITAEELEQRLRIIDYDLRTRFRIEHPCIAVAGLTINIIPVSHKIIFVKLDLKVEPTIRNNMTRFITMNALYNASLGNMTVVKP